MSIKPVLKFLLKTLSKYESASKRLSNANHYKPALRVENTIGDHAGSVSRKLISPAIPRITWGSS